MLRTAVTLPPPTRQPNGEDDGGEERLGPDGHPENKCCPQNPLYGQVEPFYILHHNISTRISSWQGRRKFDY